MKKHYVLSHFKIQELHYIIISLIYCVPALCLIFSNCALYKFNVNKKENNYVDGRGQNILGQWSMKLPILFSFTYMNT